ncbi:kelch-like protein 18 [Ornithodoros turicata]|uniref:kelch-like protein 18 n=1 Tax=Ornithodoros turicata TaxID=34597 RepID=UPI00313A4198
MMMHKPRGSIKGLNIIAIAIGAQAILEAATRVRSSFELGCHNHITSTAMASDSAGDVVISIPGCEFTARRRLLAAISPYLCEMMADTGQGERIKVELDGVSTTAFEALRGFITSGTINLNCQNVTDVYRCAFKLKIRSLVTRCLQYLAEAGPVGRQLVSFANAAELSLHEDQQIAFEYLVDHFDSTIRSRQFLELPWEPLATLLKSEQLATANEASVFIAGLAWLNHDYASRRPREDAVLGCVRYGLMNEDTLLKCFDPPMARPAIKNRFVRSRLVEAAFYHYARLRGRPELAEEYKPRPRVFSNATEPPITWNADGKVENFEVGSYTTAIQRHRLETVRRIQDAVQKHRQAMSLAAEAAARARLEEPPAVRTYYEQHKRQVVKAQSVVRCYLARRRYASLHAPIEPPALLGDMDEEEFTVRHPGSLEVPPATWSTFPAQKMPRHAGPIASADTVMVLVTGGIEPSRSYEMATGCTVMLFDPSTCLLTRCSRLPQPRHNHAAVVLNGYLYVMGGFDTRNTHRGLKFATSSCFRMKLESRAWERIADMRYSRCSHAALTNAGKVYVLAGQDEFDTFLCSVEEYNPDTNTWHEFGPPLPCRISAPGAAVTSGSIVVAGGMVQSQRRSDRVFVSSAVHRWEPKSGRWVSGLSTFPSGRASFALVEHRNRLHAIGGLTRASDETSLKVVTDVLVLEGGAWTEATALPKPLHGCQAFSLSDEQLVVFGGASTATSMAPNDEIWSFNGKAWTKIAAMPAAIAGFAAASVPALREQK